MRILRLRAGAATCTLGAIILLASPAAAQVAEPACGQKGPAGIIRANLQATSGALELPLGRKDDGVVAREIRLTWSDACTVAASQLEGKLIALPGVLVGVESSFPTGGVEVQSVDVIDKTVRIVLGVDRSRVEPGRFEGTIVLEAQDGDAAIARGEMPIVLTRQQSMFGPRLYWSPFVILVAALLGGLLFGWWRAKALSGTETDSGKQRLFAARNLVAFVGGVGAGIAAWSVQYIQTPDYRLDAKAVMALFALVATPVATALLTFLKPEATVKEPGVVT